MERLACHRKAVRAMFEHGGFGRAFHASEVWISAQDFISRRAHFAVRFHACYKEARIEKHSRKEAGARSYIRHASAGFEVAFTAKEFDDRSRITGPEAYVIRHAR